MPKFTDRDDVLPAGLAPRKVRALLAQVAGLNPYKEPLYRMVLAQHVMEWHGGEFWDWPEDAELHDQGGLLFVDELVKKKFIVQPRDEHGVLRGTPEVIECEVPVGMVPNPSQPIRRVIESRYVQKYPDLEGWVLQRWRPAKHWGPRAVWESALYPGTNICVLGPYPERGMYEMATEFVIPDGEGKPRLYRNSHYTMPALSNIEEAIAFLEEQRIDHYGSDPQVRMKIRMAEYDARRAAQQRKDSAERRQVIKDLIRPYCGASLEAQRLRNELAERQGVREHIVI